MRRALVFGGTGVVGGAVLHGLAQDTPFADDAEPLVDLILFGVARRR